MRKYRVIMVEEFSDDAYRMATFFTVQRRSRVFPWVWRSIKNYDSQNDAMFHFNRLEIINGEKRRVTDMTGKAKG